MNIRVSSKILQISLLVTLCASSILFSQDSKRTPGSHDRTQNGRIWSITDENPDFSNENLHHIVKKGTAEPQIQDAPSSADGEEWEKGWDIDLEVSSKGDLETFFPVSDEPTDTTSSPTPQAVKEIKEYDWEASEPELKVPGDISTAKKQETLFYSPTATAEDQPIKPIADNNEYFAPQAKSPTPHSLGKTRVAVPPYTSPSEDASSKEPQSQTITTQKSSFGPSSALKQAHGLFGPLKHEEKNAKSQQAAEKTPSRQRSEAIIAQVVNEETPVPGAAGQIKTPPKTIFIKFDNVSMIEYLRFISRLTNKNFIFDEADLQFNVTILSEEPTTVENVMTALVQELRIRGLHLVEEGNNLIIHRNANVRGISELSIDTPAPDSPRKSELVTQVFHLNTLAPDQARSILRALLSQNAIMETANETRHLIITDLAANMQKVDTLLKSIDAPNSGLVLGQYVVRNAFMDNLIELAKQIMQPIAQDQKLTFVPHPAAKSIFIVSSPFLVERAISVLQHLDQFQGTTRIYDLEDLKYKPILPPKVPPGVVPEVKPPEGVPPEGAISPTVPLEKPKPELAPPGKWELSSEGSWLFRPGYPVSKTFDPRELPQGKWLLDPQGNWYFSPEGVATPFPQRGTPPGFGDLTEIPAGLTPRGEWVLDPQGAWTFQLAPEERISPEKFSRRSKVDAELPIGHIERTQFSFYKLQYRKGEDIVTALQNIATSLETFGNVNSDLIATIQSVQWLETTNSLVLTGTETAIAKVMELIEEVDRPARQVLIEMLILETTIDDSLTYGVSWGTRSGGGNTSTAQTFIGGGSPIAGALATGGIGNTPDASPLSTIVGYTMGVIGRRLTHNGTQFATLGALVTAIHTRADSNIILNPKIITEDNKTAEIFVGINSPFLSNSVSNDEGSIITTNVEFKDTGTTLRVTPLIGYGDIITLEIEQEVSRTGGQTLTGGEQVQDVNLTPTTSINRTTTTVLVPDKHFVIISGMIQQEKTGNLNQFPCLGGIPVLGAAFKTDTDVDAKRNLMIFIRPQIIDHPQEYTEITRREQEIFKQKNRMKKMWKYEVDEALDFMNIKTPCCDECE